MKKLIILMVFAFVAMASTTVDAQIRTIKSDKVLAPDANLPNSITWRYTGQEVDSLTVLQDTLLYNITLNKAQPYNYYIKVGLDTIAGVDTTVVINIKGRMFDDEAWTLIETVTTAVISAEINTVIESMTDADYGLEFGADSVYVITPSIKPCWRQIQTELIIKGDDSVGDGVALKDINWYFQEAK